MSKFSIGSQVIYQNLLLGNRYEDSYNPVMFPSFPLGSKGIVIHIYRQPLTHIYLIQLDFFHYWLYEDAFELLKLDVTNVKQISIRILRELNE